MLSPEAEYNVSISLERWEQVQKKLEAAEEVVRALQLWLTDPRGCHCNLCTALTKYLDASNG